MCFSLGPLAGGGLCSLEFQDCEPGPELFQKQPGYSAAPVVVSHAGLTSADRRRGNDSAVTPSVP